LRQFPLKNSTEKDILPLFAENKKNKTKQNARKKTTLKLTSALLNFSPPGYFLPSSSQRKVSYAAFISGRHATAEKRCVTLRRRLQKGRRG